MSELVSSRGLGDTVRPRDVDGCAGALDHLTRDGAESIADRTALEPLLWRNVARPLAEYCADPGPPRATSTRTAVGAAIAEYPAFVRALYHDGGAKAIRQAATRHAVRSLRRRQPGW
jgi:hypothetical protein